MRKYWRELSAAGTILIVVGPSLWLSPTFENCIKAIPGNAAYQHQADALPFFLFFASRWFGCLGPFVDINSAAIVATFTVVLAFSTILLWLHTKRLAEGADDQAAQMAASVAEAARAASAMEGVAASTAGNLANSTQAVATQREFWQQQMRAYVLNCSTSLFDGGHMSTAPIIDRTDQPGFVIFIRNFGQTPAKAVVHWSLIQVAAIEDEGTMTPPEIIQGVAPSILGPSHQISVARWLNRPMSQEEIVGVRSGSHAIYAYGRVEYLDAFNVKRWSTYRLRYTSAAWPPIGQNGSMNFCAEGNDAN
jgi:hypothetical protein